MVALINDIGTVRKYLKVAFVNQTVMLPDFEGAQKKYLLPILGKALYEVIEAEAAGNPSNPSELLKLCLRAIVPLGYFSDLAMLSTQITDMGVGNVVAEHFSNAPRWQFLELRKNLEEKGCAALEELLIFLNEELPEGVTWTVPETYDLLLNNGKYFNQYFSISQPYRTFESLRPIVKSIEIDEIIPLIGKPFFSYLKGLTEPSDLESQALTLLKKAIAYLTIKSAAELLPVNISADGLTVALTHNTDQPNQGQQQASEVQMSVLVNSCLSSGKGYLDSLLDLLNNNASSEVFPLFFASSFYTAPTTDDDATKDSCSSKRDEDYLEWPRAIPTGLIDIDWQRKEEDSKRNRHNQTFFL